jgi:hypothetical protein
LPGGTCTHWKAPPFHGARQEPPLALQTKDRETFLPMTAIDFVGDVAAGGARAAA